MPGALDATQYSQVREEARRLNRQQGSISGDLICHSEDFGLCLVGNELPRKAFRCICWLHTVIRTLVVSLYRLY